MKTDNLTINPTGDRILIGSHFHELEDHTTHGFKTTTLEDFAACAKALKEDHHMIVLGLDSLSALPKQIDRYTKPAVECTLQVSEVLKKIVEANHRGMPFANFIAWLESMKRFTGTEGLDFLSQLRHFRLKKVMSVQADDDRRGNVSYKFSLESAGNDDFTPPERLLFTVPVFKGNKETVSIEMDVLFDVKSAGDSPELTLTLQSFSLAEEVEARKREIIAAALEGVSLDKVWGSVEVRIADDSWKYKANPERGN